MHEEEIKANQVILYLASEEGYQDKKKGILQGTVNSLEEKNVCYVSFTKPYASLKQETQQISSESGASFFYIDTTTMSVQNPPKVDDCIFIQSPNALTDISVAISTAMNDKQARAIVVDSLSSLLIYADGHTLIKFLHNIINKMRVSNIKGIFMVMKKDAGSELVNDLNMFVDKVIELN